MITVTALLAAFATISAQQPSCYDSLLATAPQMKRGALLVVSPARKEDRLPRPLSDTLLARAAAALRLPSSLNPRLAGGLAQAPSDSSPKRTEWMTANVEAIGRIAFDSSGNTVGDLFWDPAQDDALDAAFRDAIRHAISLPLPPPDKKLLHRGIITVDIELEIDDFTTKQRRDYDAKIRRGQLLEHKLGVITVPYFAGTPPAPVGRATPPRYPEVARAANVEGDVLVRFIITPQGRVHPLSVWIPEPTYEEFHEAVLDALRGYTYRPARIGRCAVAMKVSQEFRFRLRR